MSETVEAWTIISCVLVGYVPVYIIVWIKSNSPHRIRGKQLQYFIRPVFSTYSNVYVSEAVLATAIISCILVRFMLVYMVLQFEVNSPHRIGEKQVQ